MPAMVEVVGINFTIPASAEFGDYYRCAPSLKLLHICPAEGGNKCSWDLDVWCVKGSVWLGAGVQLQDDMSVHFYLQT